MEKYYTFLCETYNGDKLGICVLANSEDHARKRLSDYEVSRGGLHYICKLLDVSKKERKNIIIAIIIHLRLLLLYVAQL